MSIPVSAAIVSIPGQGGVNSPVASIHLTVVLLRRILDAADHSHMIAWLVPHVHRRPNPECHMPTWYRRFRFTEHGRGLLYAAVMREPPMRDSLKMIISASTCSCGRVGSNWVQPRRLLCMTTALAS